MQFSETNEKREKTQSIAYSLGSLKHAVAQYSLFFFLGGGGYFLSQCFLDRLYQHAVVSFPTQLWSVVCILFLCLVARHEAAQAFHSHGPSLPFPFVHYLDGISLRLREALAAGSSHFPRHLIVAHSIMVSPFPAFYLHLQQLVSSKCVSCLFPFFPKKAK